MTDTDRIILNASVMIAALEVWSPVSEGVIARRLAEAMEVDGRLLESDRAVLRARGDGADVLAGIRAAALRYCSAPGQVERNLARTYLRLAVVAYCGGRLEALVPDIFAEATT